MEATGHTAEGRADADRYPRLFAPSRWEWGGLDVRFDAGATPDELVTNIHVVGFTAAGRIVVCRDTAGPAHWFLPGGTRERGESVETCVRRELAEEAGAALAGPLLPVGAHRATADRPRPGYEWQPHPHRAWLWCAARVELDGRPLNPPDGEQVVEVREAAVEEAAELVGASDGPEFAELIRFAVERYAAARG